MTAIILVFVAIALLVTIANRIKVAYPIVLVLGGMTIGYIPRVPTVNRVSYNGGGLHVR